FQTRLWFAKINTTAGFLFITNKEAFLFIDGRYFEMASSQAKNTQVFLLNDNSLIDFANSHTNYKRIGLEKEYLTLEEHQMVKKLFPNAEFVLISGQELRIVKSDQEIQYIKKANQIALKAFDKVKRLIKPGWTEKEVLIKLENYFRLYGAEKASFDLIVASGERGSLPHGRASDRVINDNELITIDFGVFYNGYASDITRTFWIGQVGNPKLEQIRKIVYEAQQLGIKAVKPGLTTKYIDSICREYIDQKGYGQYFVHGTGHGLGIDIHELPYVSQKFKETILEPGMVITVEPGIYIPSLGGVRYEDDVLVTKNGFEILTKK
ncbi:MAG: aminopeptidase P family protein, partial [Mycoplasma sp.]|nr:aminopeptidase P family protein [Mycoplasma sp.]